MVFEPADQITTPRLVLRPPRPTDAEQLFVQVCSQPEVVRYLRWRTHSDAQATREVLGKIIESNRSCPEMTWIIDEVDGADSVGMFTCWWEDRAVELGFCLAPAAWGRGYMGEAVRHVLEEVGGMDDVDRIWATTDLENARSQATLARAGMGRSALLRKHAVHPNIDLAPRDSVEYTLDVSGASR